MDSIVFYQPPSSMGPSRSALNKSVPESIDDEDDGWEPPFLSEILAEAKRKRAAVPVHRDRPPLIQERTNGGGLPAISQTSARREIEDHVSAHVCSSRSGNLQPKSLSIEPHADPEPIQSTRCQRNPTIVAPKALDPILQDEGTCRPTALDVDGQATYEGIVAGPRNDKQHCFGDQHSSSRVEMSRGLSRSPDRTHSGGHDRQGIGAAAGNVYDIFAEYEKIFATSRKHGGTESERQGRAKHQASDASSPAPLPTQRPAKRPLESHPATLDSGRKRIHTSRPAVPTTIDADRETRTRNLVPISLSDDDSSDDNDDESLDPVATSQQRGPPPVVPEDNQYLVEHLLKRQVRRLHGGRRRVKYLVQWKGYGPEHNSWVCQRDIHPELVRAFHVSTF